MPWHAYANRYWPAKYFVDRRGHVRFVHFGEGEYERSEEVIRTLLAEDGGGPRPEGGRTRRRLGVRAAPDAGDVTSAAPRPVRR